MHLAAFLIEVIYERLSLVRQNKARLHKLPALPQMLRAHRLRDPRKRVLRDPLDLIDRVLEQEGRLLGHLEVGDDVRHRRRKIRLDLVDGEIVVFFDSEEVVVAACLRLSSGVARSARVA